MSPLVQDCPADSPSGVDDAVSGVVHSARARTSSESRIGCDSDSGFPSQRTWQSKKL